MERLLSEIVTNSSCTSLQLLRSSLPATDVVREYLEALAERCASGMTSFDMREGSKDELTTLIQTVSTAMKRSEWVYIANVTPLHDQLLRKVALLAFTTDAQHIHPDFRLWLSTLTMHTSFEPAPIHSGISLPRVLLHLCNAPQSLLGDLDIMRIVERHAPDRTVYDGEGFDSAMADIAEQLFQNDPTVTQLRYEPSKSRAHGAAFFLMLPGAFKYNTALVELDLHSCCIGEEGAKKLGNSLKCNKGLTNINLTRNQLRDVCVENLAAGLCANSTLRRLNLSYNTALGNEGLRSLGRCFSNEGCHLREFLFDYNNSLIMDNAWSRDAICELWNGIVKSRLETLSMKGCELSGFSSAQFAECLSSNASLKHIDLSCNRLGDEGVVPFARILKKERNTTLAELLFDDCSLGAATAAAFGAALQKCRSLVSLSLCGSNPGKTRPFKSIKLDLEEEMLPTPELIFETDELTEAQYKEHIAGSEEVLTLQEDCESGDGIELLAAGLSVTKTLKTLRLGSCMLTDPLIKVLCTALTEHNNTLTDLDLSGNLGVGDSGSQAVQLMMRGGFGGEHGCGLKVVNVSSNSELFGERIILSLDSTPVELLDLRNVGVTDGVALTLRDSLSRNPVRVLSKLDLSQNMLHKEGFARMGEVLLNTSIPLKCLILAENLNTAHIDTFSPLHEAGSHPPGLPMFKDGGVDELSNFHTSLGQLGPDSKLEYLNLSTNTLTDACITDLLAKLDGLQAVFTIDLQGNLHTPGVIPLIDGFALKNSCVTITIGEEER